jgi:hypothetical protein
MNDDDKYIKISERTMLKTWRKCLDDNKPYAGYFIYLMLQTSQVKKLGWNYAKLARNYHIKNFIMCEINYNYYGIDY